jgi:hypothetical protein
MSKVIMIPADTRYFTGNQAGQQTYGRPAVTNKMKGECIGEFTWKEQADYYDEDGNVVEHTAIRTVPWDLCKEIYRRMAHVAATEAL